MKKYCVLCLSVSLLILSSLASAERYFVTAKEGLFLRQSPSLEAKKVGKLPYGYIVDSDDKNNSSWRKVTYSDFPYVVNFENKNLSTAYVYSDYLDLIDQKKYREQQISKQEFDRYLKRTKTQKRQYKVVRNYQKIKKLLGSNIIFERINQSDRSSQTVSNYDVQLKQLTTEDGFTHQIGKAIDEASLVGFYPELDLLLFEWGHSTDLSFNTKTGEVTETTGNPYYMVESPSSTYRINGIYHGQECVSYFFQQKKERRYTYHSMMNDGYMMVNDICTLTSFDWLTDTSFIYSHDYFIANQEKPKKKYYFGEIVE